MSRRAERWLARAALAALAAGALTGMYLVRVYAPNYPWGDHPRLLTLIAAAVATVLAVVGAIAAVVALVAWLWGRAR